MPPAAAALPIGSENQTTSLRSRKCTPIGAAHHFPRRGKFALHLPLVSYVMNNISVISRLRRLPPIRLRRTSPYSGGRINRREAVISQASLGIAPLESPPPGETPPKAAEGVHFPRPSGRLACFPLARQGGCMVLSYWRPLFPKGRPPRPPPPPRQRPQPLVRAVAQGHTPLCAEGAGPFGNTAASMLSHS